MEGGGSDSPSVVDEPTKSGVFLDSAVKGLKYSTLTQNGTTDVKGTFKYKDNETVTFTVGGIVIGSAKAKDKMSPLDLVGVTDPKDIKVVNMLKFLQSIDKDNNLENGIEISQELKDSASTATDNFNNTVDVDGLLVSLGIESGNIVTKENAIVHFKNTLNTMIGNPSNTDEFSIVKGIYQDGETILEVTSSGLINSYKYSTMLNCVAPITSSNAAYNLDGLSLRHDVTNKKFFLTIGDTELGWRYQNNVITQVFAGGMSAGKTLNTNNIFLTTKVSTSLTTENLKNNFCSALGASNKFKNVKGVYQYADYVKKEDAALETLIRNSVTHIDSNGIVHAYKEDTNNNCLKPTVKGDINFVINAKSLSKSAMPQDDALFEYHANDSMDNKFAWIENDANSIEFINYFTTKDNFNKNIIYMKDLKELFTIVKSSKYTDANIASSMCSN